MTSRNTFLLVFVVLTLGLMLGFTNSNDPVGSKTNAPFVVDETVYPPAISSSATVIYVDSLNGANDTVALNSRGYKVWYRGAGPQGVAATWFQGNPTVFSAFNGPTSGYVAANYQVVTGTNNIDSWLVSPRLSIAAGDSLMFWEQCPLASTFPDSMRVMYSAAGDSVPEATSWVELGRFKGSTGGSWVQRKYRMATAGANGRFALRYNVVAGGPNGLNSDFMGVDMITVTRDAVTPGTCTYTWVPNTSGTTSLLYSVSAVSNLVGWAGGAAATVRKTVDGGVTWTNANPTPGVITGDIYNIYAWSANDAIVTTSPGATFIYKTSNGGTTWTQVYTLAGGFINALQMISATEGYAEGDPVGGKWTILKTTDGGNSWARMATEPTQVGTEAGWNNSFQVLGTHIWFGTSTTKVYHSPDLGVTWTGVAATGVASTFAVHYNSATTGLTGGSGTNMLKSTDGGNSYVSAGPLPGASGSLNGLEGSGTDWWSVRSGADVYRSTNQGGTWTTVYTVAGAVFNDIDFKDVSGCPTGWAVTSTGGIAKMNSTIVGISSYSSEIPNSYLLKQNFPNPFNPTTNINFTIPQSGFVTLKVYNTVGMEVATLLNENKPASSYVIGFNAASLPSGAYFYRIETGNFTDTKKMMLIK
ncbi:MAG: choice-of-anchor J domain-containing protein [Ignavibacteria bacterium]|nr:choice-of-anchor J domain-containing protein [Ignavibacteria bacterium]